MPTSDGYEKGFTYRVKYTKDGTIIRNYGGSQTSKNYGTYKINGNKLIVYGCEEEKPTDVYGVWIISLLNDEHLYLIEDDWTLRFERE